MTASGQTAKAAQIAAATPPHDSFAQAWVAALAELTVVEANRTAEAGSFAYKYADLGDVVKRTRPVLARHGLVVDQELLAVGDGLGVRTMVTHTSGEERGFGPLTFPHGRDAQATGSAITYHRRYALIAALGMAAGDDDDGAAAAPPAPRPRTVAPKSLAKARLLELVDADKSAAKEAWAGIAGDGVKWNGDPAAELEALYEAWVNQPKDGES